MDKLRIYKRNHIALELQKAYGSDIDVSKFLYSKGLNCSVYHKRDTIGLANYI